MKRYFICLLLFVLMFFFCACEDSDEDYYDNAHRCKDLRWQGGIVIENSPGIYSNTPISFQASDHCVELTSRITATESGESTYCLTSTYNENGNLIDYQQDADCDGNPESCQTSRYNDHGSRIYLDSDDGCDGVLEESNSYAYTYDEDGRILTYQSMDCWGPVCTRYFYDDEGKETGYEVDTGCNGVADTCVRIEHDCEGNRLQITSFDEGCDGTTDSIQFSAFDDDGHLISSQTDENGDGQPDANCAFYVFFKVDGVVDHIQNYHRDTECDGVPDYNCNSYTLDDDGRLIEAQIDENCDGLPESCESYSYDNQGNLLDYNLNNDCNAPPEWCAHFTYDDHGTLHTIQMDDGCDNNPEGCQTYTYDDQGNPLTSERDDGCDGNPESITTKTYACF